MGGYASNMYKDSYWYFLPLYLLQVLILIHFAYKNQKKLYYVVIIIISLLYVGSYLRLISSVILPY
ncbi:Ca2+/Na+ antiporter [Arcicella sp. BE140]|nr:Ca2+/Na+ antiporter [Arcicella sp. BE51]MDR6813723.1 Ca2+/Na+ antiporter [Arcicella sp. BE140]MDR6825035.1 Ca2+/Na+ antiporter [Arcicella sp. BE139]